jgi:hypothetical protein
MDHQKVLDQLKDSLHREIVQESTCKICQQMDTTDGVLLLVNPIVLHIQYYHPERDDFFVEVKVLGVNCNTGDLVGEDLDGNDRNIRYRDLTAENLLELYKLLKTNQYQFTEYHLL